MTTSLQRDSNHVPVLGGVYDDGSGTIAPLSINAANGRLKVTAILAGGNGITSINGDSTAAQLITVGTAGTDVAVSNTVAGTTTINIPTASGTNRGVITSALYNTFNGKAEANQTFYIGTTQVAINRASASLSLAGVNIDGSAGSATTAGSVTNATFTTALTVNTGTLTLTANNANNSVLTIGAGAVSVSGSNTGDNTVATALTGTPSIIVNTVTTTGNIELGNASDCTVARVGAGQISVESVVVPTISSTNTFTNKRITPRILSATSYTTDTGTSLNCDNLDQFIVTAQAGAIKLNNPTGTPTDGQKLIVAITGTGARAVTYDTQFEASTVALPSTTVTTARLNMGFIWRADTSKWVLVATS